MLMLITWDFDPENREKVYERFRAVRAKAYPGVDAIGRWHTVGRLGGAAVVKVENEEALAPLILDWSDIARLNAEPVLDDEAYAREIGSGKEDA